MDIKRILIGVVAVFGLWWLFAPKAPAPVDTVVVPLNEQSTEAPIETTTSTPASTTAASNDSKADISPGTITLTGTFVGLVESEPDGDNRIFLYLLLNDETEVMRIDLRPLLGYTDFNPEARLGVERGDRVRVTGQMVNDGEKFAVETITAL